MMNPMDESAKSLGSAELTLLWGNPSALKARLRSESIARFRALTLGERLKASLAMVRSGDRRGGSKR